MAKIRITQVRSAIKRPTTQRLTLQSLGLGKLYQSVEKEKSDSIQGMIDKVSHLIKVKSI